MSRDTVWTVVSSNILLISSKSAARRLPMIFAISFNSSMTPFNSFKFVSHRSAEDCAFAAISSLAACWFARPSMMELFDASRFPDSLSSCFISPDNSSTAPAIVWKLPSAASIYFACSDTASTLLRTRSDVWLARSVTPFRSCVMLSMELLVSSASFRISSATTANPRPCSPARAASMLAFNASRFVWLEIW